MDPTLIGLQTQVRRLRLTVAAMSLGGIAYVCMGAAGGDVEDELKIRRLVVVDAAGNERAVLACQSNSPVLSFSSVKQSASAHFGIGKRGDAFVALETANGDGATLTSGGGGRPPQLVVLHGKDTKVFSTDTGKPRVSPVTRNE